MMHSLLLIEIQKERRQMSNLKISEDIVVLARQIGKQFKSEQILVVSAERVPFLHSKILHRTIF